MRANLIDVLLMGLYIEDAVVGEFCSADLQLAHSWYAFDACAFVSIAELAADHGPYTHRYFN